MSCNRSNTYSNTVCINLCPQVPLTSTCDFEEIQKEWTVYSQIQAQNGKEKERTLYHDGFSRKVPTKQSEIDKQPNLMMYACRTSLIDRLKAGKCELCGATGAIQMHHINKLGDLSGKENWEN